VLTFSVLVFLASTAAGFLGSLTGLGGGVVVTPVLALLFHVDLRYAMGASLVSVIATSSGAASAYVREGYSNVRIGLFLEIATTLGALGGAHLATILPTYILSIILGLVLLYSAYASTRPLPDHLETSEADPLAARLHLNGNYPVAGRAQPYVVRRVKGGFAVMLSAGLMSGLLGIGSGALKVIAMDQVMRIPFKVSTTTSNFMIGVTAAASAGIYLSRGFIQPAIAMPVMLGVLAGSLIGARKLGGARIKSLRLLFAFVVAALAIEMIYGGVSGKL
jgi:uncharacterized membrane protein YfcA